MKAANPNYKLVLKDEMVGRKKRGKRVVVVVT